MQGVVENVTKIYCKFIAESNSEITLKTGTLVKVMCKTTRLECHVFFSYSVIYFGKCE